MKYTENIVHQVAFIYKIIQRCAVNTIYNLHSYELGNDAPL